jgi:hypothetical protein
MESILKDFCDKLFAEVKHGDQEHQDWLEEKINSFQKEYPLQDTVQEVEVYVRLSGYYCAFHEMSASVVYDVTNDIKFDDLTLEECKNYDFDGDDSSDVGLVKAILYKGQYYIKPF